jgi:hypothetical protein
MGGMCGNTQYVRVRIHPDYTLFLPVALGSTTPESLLREVETVCDRSLLDRCMPAVTEVMSDSGESSRSPTARGPWSDGAAKDGALRLVRVAPDGKLHPLECSVAKPLGHLGVEQCQMLLLQRRTVHGSWAGLSSPLRSTA